MVSISKKPLYSATEIAYYKWTKIVAILAYLHFACGQTAHWELFVKEKSYPVLRFGDPDFL